jgi:glycosyltransferase involved in cell wall biosynthesis
VYFKRADAIWVTSNEDKVKYSNFIDANKLDVIPNFLIESWYNNYSNEKDNYIVFSASFNSFQNLNGLIWFLKNVWSYELSEKTELVLAGIGSEEALEKCRQSGLTISNVKATGYIKDIRPYISRAKISIVPLLEGSGTRLKIIEAMALKTLVISTSLGAQGMSTKNLIIADTPAKFKEAILRYLNRNDDRVSKAFVEFLNNYSMKYIKSQINRSLATLSE